MAMSYDQVDASVKKKSKIKNHKKNVTKNGTRKLYMVKLIAFF